MRCALLVLAALALAADAGAETCTAIPVGSYTIAAPGGVFTITDSSGGTTGYTDCTESADDIFQVPSSVELNTSGNVEFSTGNFQLTGGTLNHTPGTTVSWSSATTGGIEFASGATSKVRHQGAVLWEGRIATNVTYSTGPARAAFDIPVPSISGLGITTGDYVVVGDDDPDSSTAWIQQPVQTTNGPPIPGYHRPSLRKYAWHKIQAAPASSTLTLHTNDFTDAESLAPANEAYDGTRGPLLPTATTITGAPTRVATDVGIVSRIQLGAITAKGDGDAMGQYVEFVTGACVGDMPSKIAWLDDNGATDAIYAFGDLSGCGSGVDIIVHYGLRYGDRIRIVRPAILSGTNGQNGPSIDWKIGTWQADHALFKYLDDDTVSSLNACNVCIYREASSEPDFENSYVTNSAFVYGQSSTSATGVFNFYGTLNGTSYIDGSGPLDVSGFKVERVYKADQAEDVSTEGLHGDFGYAATGYAPERFRYERLGDDGMVWIGYHIGGNNAPQTLTGRHGIIQESWDSSGNSQQCLDLTADTASALASVSHLAGTFTFSDMSLFGCADQLISEASLGSTFSRITASGGQSVGGVRFGQVSAYSSLPTGALATQPTQINNSIILLYGPATGSNVSDFGAAVNRSIVAGNGLHTGAGAPIRNLVSADGTLFHMGTTNSPPFGRNTTGPAFRFSTMTGRNFAFLNSSTSSTPRTFCDAAAMASNSVFTGFDLTRAFFAVERVALGSGFLGSCLTGTDTTQPFVASGVTLSVKTPQVSTWGRVGSNLGTAQGANITNSCSVSTGVKTGSVGIGANAPESTVYLPTAVLPLSDQDLNIGSLIVQPGAESSICNGLARPEYLGQSEFGVAHGMLGGGYVKSILSGNGSSTTDAELVRTLGGGGGGSAIFPGAIYP